MRYLWTDREHQRGLVCPVCQEEHLLLISTEWEGDNQYSGAWLADFYECQWCGEEFKVRPGSDATRRIVEKLP